MCFEWQNIFGSFYRVKKRGGGEAQLNVSSRSDASQVPGFKSQPSNPKGVYMYRGTLFDEKSDNKMNGDWRGSFSFRDHSDWGDIGL